MVEFIIFINHGFVGAIKMNTIISKTKLALVTMTLPLILANLVSCGGESSESVAPNVTATNTAAPQESASTDTSLSDPIDYSPEATKLSSIASSSTDLYVEADFNFSSHKLVIFDINIRGIDNTPTSNAMLSISMIDADIVDFDDPKMQDKALITKALSDNNGQIYLSMELPNTVNQVLLELNALGVENDVIIKIDDSGNVIHHFNSNQG
jgi:hypothetical protein